MKIETKFMDTNNDNVLETKEGYDYSHLDPKSGLIKEGTKLEKKLLLLVWEQIVLNQYLC